MINIIDVTGYVLLSNGLRALLLIIFIFTGLIAAAGQSKPEKETITFELSEVFNCVSTTYTDKRVTFVCDR
jgi:hypothetical protein